MNMVWVAILALVAGLDGRSSLKDREVGRPATVLTIRAGTPAPSRSLSVARRVGHRPSSTPWSSPGLDEYDSSEGEDDSWVVHLDALATVPLAWFTWARPKSSAEAKSIENLDLHSLACFPLRC